MSKWLTIIGMGEDGYDGLSASARLALSQAEHVIGSERLLPRLPNLNAALHEWPQPFSKAYAQIEAFRGKPTAILATGDPMNYGVARKILTRIPVQEVTILPHLSAFSLAAARMGWSLPDCDCITIHGRPASGIEAFVHPNTRLLVLTQDGSSIAEVATRLCNRGFGGSAMTILENLGGAQEAITTCRADAVPERIWSPLNTLAIECLGGPAARILSRLAGLPDEAFEHDGKMTKREVRAVTLAALCPAPDQLLWDIGAGAGSIAIEWMRSARGCGAIAIESDPERCRAIARNADALGTSMVQIVEGSAPAVFAGLPQPDAVFIGGGIEAAGLVDQAWQALKPGGRCVANTVTLEGEMRLIGLQKMHGGELVRMSIERLAMIGELHAMRPLMPVLQWRVNKPW